MWVGWEDECEGGLGWVGECVSVEVGWGRVNGWGGEGEWVCVCV